jgi:hypothetical protein
VGLAEGHDDQPGEDDELLVELQRRFAGQFNFKADPAANVEDFKILNAATEQPLE